MPPKIPKEDLLAELQRLAEDLGRTPKVSDMNDIGKYSNGPYNSTFGTWSAALEEAGLEPTHNKHATKADLIQTIEEVADELGRTPKRSEAVELGKYSASKYYTIFGSWTAAIKEVGLEPHRRPNVCKDEIISDLQRVADQLQRVPERKEFNEFVDYHATTVERRFGTWGDAVVEAGLIPNRNYGATDAELLEHLGELAKELGDTPSANYMTDNGRYGANSYLRRFGSWDNAVEAAGLEPYEHPCGEEHPFWVEEPAKRLYYGPNWDEQRAKARERDGHECQRCGVHEEGLGRALDVHHKIPFREYLGGEGKPDYQRANRLENLISYCPSCHSKVEEMAPLCPIAD